MLENKIALANLEKIKIEIDDLTYCAPFDGTVTKIWVNMSHPVTCICNINLPVYWKIKYDKFMLFISALHNDKK